MRGIIFFQLFLLVIILWSCVDTVPTFNEVQIRSVDEDITTFYSIGCKNFESSFGETIDTISINDPEKIRELKNCLDDSKKSFEGSIDVRTKVILLDHGKQISTICLDKFGHFSLYSAKYKGSQCLLDLVHNYRVKK